MRRPFVAGNWKMNGSINSIRELLTNIKQGCERVEVAELAVFPSYPYLALCEEMLCKTQVGWGAQNASDQVEGAFTGEVSINMLHDFNCQYVLLGHSERRHIYMESDEFIAAKLKRVLASSIIPVLCVGETQTERVDGKTFLVIERQLAAIHDFDDNQPGLGRLVIAYEPVWAIGTGKVATPEQAEEVHAYIRGQLAKRSQVLAEQIRIVYGGSVKPDNAAEMLAMRNIDGALVGGASLDASSFLKIGLVCNNSF